MTVAVELSVAPETFALGEMFPLEPGTHVEFCRLVPVDQGQFPLFWLRPADADDVPAALRGHPSVESLTRLTAVADAALYGVSWDLDDAFVAAVRAADGVVARATGTAASWSFRLQFPSRASLREFDADCRDRGVGVDVDRVQDAGLPGSADSLTAEQRTALVEAYHRGFFDVPRGVTQEGLAEALGVSDSAVSQRVRRGMARLVADALLTEE